MENTTANLNVSKQLKCSKQTLYNAWTKPEQLKEWWKPLGYTLTDVVNDIKQGGEVKYTFEDNKLTIDGRYERVEDEQLLEYTWNWHLKGKLEEDAAYKLLIQFDGDDSNASVSVTQTGFEDEESIQPHKQGWEQGLQQLEEYLSGESNSDNNGQNSSGINSVERKEQQAEEKYMPPVTGYNETEEQAKVGGA